ncbi:MAG: mycofactocin system glycosyltransferase [Mycobacterium sp.]|nr:mycofactocin system glycosyltransferase [Mycobacterium sp.]
MTARAPSLDPSVRLIDDGRVLIGGSPLRLLTLSPTARDILAGQAWDSRAGRSLASRLITAGFAHPHPTGGPTVAEVSVVIPVRDRPEAVRHLIAGLDPALEVIVVDDGSEPPLPGATVRHPSPLGPSAARNAGIGLATRPFVALIDSDAVPPNGWLDPLLPHFSDPQLAAVAPRIVTTRGGTTSWRERTLAGYDAARSPLDLGSRPARVSAGSRVSYVPAAALVLRRSALGDPDSPSSAQAFDESLRYGEDVDLIWRLISAGWTVRYEPAAAVGHAHRPTLRAAVAQRFGYGLSAAPLARRHPGSLAPFVGSRWTLAAWALLASGHPRSAVVTLAAAATRLSRTLPVERPIPLATRLVGTGSLAAGRSLGEALTRPYAPIALPLLLSPGPFRKARRRVALAALVVPSALEYRRRKPEVGPLRWLALRAVDDLAYGAGVCVGCLRERSTAALRPRFT